MNYYAEAFHLEEVAMLRSMYRNFGMGFFTFERNFATRSIATPLYAHIWSGVFKVAMS